MDKNGHIVVHRVGLEEQLALADGVVLLDVRVAQALEAERELHPQYDCTNGLAHAPSSLSSPSPPPAIVLALLCCGVKWSKRESGCI